MKRVQPLAACAALLLVTATAGVLAEGSDHRRVLRAHAVIQGAGGSIQGIVTFKQQPCPGCPTPGLDAPATHHGFRGFPEPSVDVVARISGPPGVLAPGAHGMHIHQYGVCDAASSYGSAGGHFDPGPYGHSDPVDANHPFHMGDLPNLIVNNRGKGFMKHTTSRITLSPGPLSLFDADGSAVIVHMNPDRGITGEASASGGPRIACGIVQLTTPGEMDDDED